MNKLKISILFFLGLLLFVVPSALASEMMDTVCQQQVAKKYCIEVDDTVLNSIAINSDSLQTIQKNFPVIYRDSLQTIQKNVACKIIHPIGKQEKKRWVAAITAFPFPFGFVGAHRIMLGTKPWVPIVYIATFGGCFGLLPLIDFCVILFSKDIQQYENNPNIFMWIK
jgi:TM2 domain-containing membrane protein YozV